VYLRERHSANEGTGQGRAVKKKRHKAKKRTRHGKLRASPSEVLLKALNHPLRRQAFKILSERVASPTEISDDLDEPLSNVSYHVRVLDELGLVEVVEEEAVRGSVAHYYKGVEGALVDNPGWTELDSDVRNALSKYLIDALINDAADSLKQKLFDSRDDRHISHTPLLLDEEGWREVAAIHATLLNGVLKAQARAAERLKERESEAIHAVSGILFFQTIPPCAASE